MVDLPHGWTRDRLTEVLGAPGVVTDVDWDAEERPWSNVATMRLTWRPEGAGPSALISKRVPCEVGAELPSEVTYYNRDYLDVSGAPMPRCFFHRVDADGYLLLLEDVSRTHATGFEVGPNEAWAEGVARSLARLHAAHVGIAATLDQPKRFVSWCVKGLSHALAEVSAERQAKLQRCFDGLEARLSASLRRSELTLLHGDPSPGNILYPREGGEVLIIDRQPLSYSLEIGPAGWDLAVLMAQHWHPHERRAYEKRVISTYCSARASFGAPIDEEAVWAEYRDGVWITVAHAVEWLVDPKDRVERRDLWQMFFDRTLSAWDELQVDD